MIETLGEPWMRKLGNPYSRGSSQLASPSHCSEFPISFLVFFLNMSRYLSISDNWGELVTWNAEIRKHTHKQKENNTTNQGLNPQLLHLLHWQEDSLPLSHLGKGSCMSNEKGSNYLRKNSYGINSYSILGYLYPNTNLGLWILFKSSTQFHRSKDNSKQ